MTNANLAAFDHVIIRCPACGASEDAHPRVLSDAPMIVCRKCGETWPGAPARKKRRTRQQPGDAQDDRPGLLEAERRPLVTYSGGAESAWAAKVEGDWWPQPAQRSRIPMMAAAMAAAMFLAAFFGGRQAAVAALPDLAGLYAAIGMPVNLDGLLIEDLAAERSSGENGVRLTVRGVIRNVSGAEQAVPPLTASVQDSALAVAGWRGFDAPARVMAAGEAAPFLLELDGVPRQAANIVIRFRRPAEDTPGAEEGGTAAR